MIIGEDILLLFWNGFLHNLDPSRWVQPLGFVRSGNVSEDRNKTDEAAVVVFCLSGADPSSGRVVGLLVPVVVCLVLYLLVGVKAAVVVWNE